MLLACRLLGPAHGGVLEADHPWQRRILGHVADFCGVPAGEIGLAVDGCGIPTYHLPLAAAARGYAALAHPEAAGAARPASPRRRRRSSAR